MESLPVDKRRWLPLSVLKNTIRYSVLPLSVLKNTIRYSVLPLSVLKNTIIYSILPPGISIFVKIIKRSKTHNVLVCSSGITFIPSLVETGRLIKVYMGKTRKKKILRLCHNLSFFLFWQEDRLKRGPKAGSHLFLKPQKTATLLGFVCPCIFTHSNESTN